MREHEHTSRPRKRTRVIRLAGASPEQELAALASLSQRTGTSALLIAELRGAGATVGRFQARGSSHAKSEHRRFTGGRSTRAGDGIVSLSALAPGPQAWLDEPGVLSGPRLLNRWVRGLLGGLAKLGVPASYPGRDFALANGRRIAYVSLSRESSGVAIFQAVLALEAPYTTAEREPQWPGLPTAPEPTTLARERGGAPDFAAIAAALAAGFAERMSLELDDAPLSADEAHALAAAVPPALDDPSLVGLVRGAPVATPIGELTAHVALDGERRLARVRLRGDWIAAPSDVEALEGALVGELPDGAHVRELCAAWLAAPAVLVVGVTEAAALCDA
ncbi:MAG: hypothetical protein ACRDMZ_10715, partial [Solirubrobacteraceae bacterium]